ncbi:MAG: cobalt transporter CbiM [Synechococcaceae cyanobacterium RM1_1_27]|nr:cobalt transporter CbiM [Synechococcaceae cyanobacterium RM1_1_27]
MHIPDGILPSPVWISGFGITALATGLTLRQINHTSDPYEQIPKASLMTAAFFVGSAIYLPLGPTSIHLLLNGMMGIVLGLYSLPAILVGLLFQAIIVGHGGLTTLGINGVILGLPALIARPVFLLYRRFPQPYGIPWSMGVTAFVASALTTALTVLVFFLLLISSLDQRLDVVAEKQAILVLSLSHLPLMLVEGLVAAFLVVFLYKVRPELLEDPS